MPRGRPQRPPLEPMRARAWMAGVMKTSGATSAYQVAKLFDATLEKRFEKYAHGTVSPSISTLRLVDKRFPNTKRIYDDGPAENVPLWQAMDGPVEVAWECLVKYDSDFESMRRVGTPQERRVEIFAEKLNLKPVAADYKDRANGLEPNLIERQINQSADVQRGIGLDELAALIALWRVSMFLGTSSLPTLYLLEGVCNSVVLPALLAPWKIQPAEFVDFLMAHKQQNLERFSHLLPLRPRTKEPRGW